MERKLMAALSLVAVVALGACSSAGGGANPTAAAGGATSGTGGGGAGNGAGAGAGGAAPSDPCSLLTQAEASAAIGKPVGAGSNATDSHECEWDYPNSDSPTASGTITIQDGDLASYCGKPSDPALGLVIEPVANLGDGGACFTYVSTTTIGSNLTFSKNGHVYTTAAYFGGGTPIATVKAADIALATAALTHL